MPLFHVRSLMTAEYYARYSFYPPYCQMRPSSSYGLSFNYNGGNYGSCSSTRTLRSVAARM